MNYTKEYEELMRTRKVYDSKESVMQRADRRYKRLIERGIITKEEPFIVTGSTNIKIEINK